MTGPYQGIKSFEDKFYHFIKLENSLVCFTSDPAKGDETKKSPSQRTWDYQRKQIHLSKKKLFTSYGAPTIVIVVVWI